MVYNLHLLRNTLYSSMASMSQFMNHSMDNQLLEIQKIALTIELNEDNRKIKKNIGPDHIVSSDDYDLSQVLSTFTLTNKTIADLFIYYPSNQYVIGSLGVFPSQSFYMLNNQLDSTGYQDWLVNIDKTIDGFRLIELWGQTRIVYIRRMNSQGNVAGIMVVMLNPGVLFQDSERVVDRRAEKVSFGMIVDGQPLPDNQGEEDSVLSDPEPSKADKPKDNNKFKYVLRTESRLFPGIEYVNSYNLPHNLQAFIYPLLICVTGILAIGILGWYMSVRIGKRNAAPIESLLHKLHHSNRVRGNEYDIINKSIDNLVFEHGTQLQKLQIQQNMITGLFINTLINTDNMSEKDIFNFAQLYDISFENDFFVVVLIKTFNTSNNGVIKKLHTWLEENTMESVVSVFNHQYVLLLNVESSIAVSTLIPLMTELTEQDLWGKTPLVGIGSCVDNLSSIKDSYHNAIVALKESSQVNSSPVKAYQKGMTERSDQNLNNYFDSLYNSIVQNNFPDIRLFFDLFFSQCISVSETMEDLKYHLTPLVDLIKDISQHQNIDLQQLGDPFFDFSNQREMRLNLLQFWDTLEIRLSKTLNGERNSLAEKAKTIIHRDYTNSLLGLYSIAEELNVSNSYLSSTFKQVCGVGIVQYINQLRINLAKEFILKTDMNIKEIATAVGFSSDISFIRVFKKYESRTPNTLRKKN
ncbi:helix-turn-helix domain-containing protein [Spirochaeta cellobiosiphila]|uniref:helix-turn-helix domain-containing protein n=1 Tax=Spirochaeta cellobiosiphila TaxID=504483 RepID=UPI001B7FB5E7|nr:helix-turn-helix domain-containing protein [Spirochaeta cellobiosiphila]